MTKVEHLLVAPTDHPGLESLAASIAMVSGLIRSAEQWPHGVVESGHKHGCRELALRYMRVLASAAPDRLVTNKSQPLQAYLDPDHEALYPDADD